MLCALAAYNRARIAAPGVSNITAPTHACARVNTLVSPFRGRQRPPVRPRQRFLDGRARVPDSAPSADGQHARHSSSVIEPTAATSSSSATSADATVRGDRLLDGAHGVHEFQYRRAQSIFGVDIGRHRDRRDVRRDQVRRQRRPECRAESLCAPTPKRADRWARRPSPSSAASPTSFALLPLSQLLVQRNRLAGKDSRSTVAELSQQRIGDVVDGERMLAARPRRCAHGTAPAAARHRARRAAHRHRRCGRRQTARRSLPAGNGAASRGSARFPTARRCAVCPSSRRRRAAAPRAADRARKSAAHRRPTGP